jgi:hypothetical protein
MPYEVVFELAVRIKEDEVVVAVVTVVVMVVALVIAAKEMKKLVLVKVFAVMEIIKQVSAEVKVRVEVIEVRATVIANSGGNICNSRKLVKNMTSNNQYRS